MECQEPLPSRLKTDDKLRMIKTPDLEKKKPSGIYLASVVVYHRKFEPRRWTFFILKWNTMWITEIYKFLQYFELMTDDYKRIPAVSLYQTSDIRLCFLLFLEKWLVVPRRSSVFTRSLDNGKIIITSCMGQKTTQNYGYKSRNLNCCYSYSSNRNTAPRHRIRQMMIVLK